eukprot:TRINITY_DN4209_c0_g1_i1.p1 TRINITY_DN4209_c0_g1~~TRINITY_DN4209_c0_g1_i1.p1  ORF type:complete len:101 (-),score=18.63 TRINITY_DN4209_c0_g1_i1:1-303(-)
MCIRDRYQRRVRGTLVVMMELSSEEKENIEDFLSSMEDYVPTIPDECVEYYLNKTGFMCSDVKVKRVVSLAAQKFISDVANDALIPVSYTHLTLPTTPYV